MKMPMAVLRYGSFLRDVRRTALRLRGMPLSICLAFLLLPATAFPQQGKKETELTRILSVMDASNTMNAFWGNEPPINAARRGLLEALAPLDQTQNVDLAQRLYGHQMRLEPGQQPCD